MTEVDELKVRVVEKMGQKGILRNKHAQIDTVVNYFRTDQQGDVKDAIDELIKDPSSPVRRYRQNTIRLTSAEETRKYLREHDGDIPFRLEE